MAKGLFKIFSIAGPLLFPLFVKAQAAKHYQIAEANAIIRFTEKHEEPAAREILMIAAHSREKLTEKYRLPIKAPVEIRLSATTYEFCQVTGRPWWQASIYQGRVIYLQPVRVLRERGILETTLRHELMHQLVDENGKGNSPAWLNEALAIYNSGEVAFLKPLQKKAALDELKWNRLEKRLGETTNKAEAERLYFQFYHLGQFLETIFTSGSISLLLTQLGERAPFDQACRTVFEMSAEAIEQNWLLHWTKTAP
jgi:hypothetical protein